MGFNRAFQWLFFVVGCFALLGASTEGRASAVQFKAATITLPAAATRPYSLDLRTLLTNLGNGSLNWTASADMPAWLTLDSAGALIKGTPKVSDVGIKSFKLTVRDSASSATATLSMNVVSVPIWSSDPIDLGTQSEGTPFSIDFKTKVTSPDGSSLTFALEVPGSLPAWLSLTASGNLSGTPQRKDVGQYRGFAVVATTAAGTSSKADIRGEVLKTVHPPKWIANPTALADANEDFNYSASLGSLVLNSEGAPLSFRMVSGPPSGWLRVGASGVLTGIPRAIDVGANSLFVEVSSVIDGKTYSDTAQITLKVNHTNHPPYWSIASLSLGSVVGGALFSKDLSPLAADPDHDALSYSLVTAPAWLTLSSKGVLAGTPAKTDVGPFTITVAVSDGKASASVSGSGAVVAPPNQPPVIHPGALSFVVKERDILTVDLSQPTYVSDADGDPLTFQTSFTEPWVKLSAAGQLRVSPGFSEIGSHSVNFTVSDQKNSPVAGSVTVLVQRNPRPPVWLTDSIPIAGKVGVAVGASVSSQAKDLDGLKITFSKKSGPGWLTVSPEGQISGTPGVNDSGTTSARLSVANDLLSAETNLILDIKALTVSTIAMAVDAPVTGASVEVLWVVDNPWGGIFSEPLLFDLKKNIATYSDRLKVAGIQHRDIILSTDAALWKGNPVRDSHKKAVLLSESPKWSVEFAHRVFEAWGWPFRNSPLWSLFRFYQKAPKAADIYHPDFFNGEVPAEVFILSRNRDEYRRYTAHTAEAKFSPEDFAEKFKQFHFGEKKSYRVSAIGPAIPKEELDPKHGSDSYRILTAATGGHYYPLNSGFHMKSVVEDFAKRVVFRSYTEAKRRIALSPAPSPLVPISLSLGGKPVSGNTGGADDMWVYNQPTGEIILHWYRIDSAGLKPGDQIVIRYEY